jgi:hypothetical protein
MAGIAATKVEAQMVIIKAYADAALATARTAIDNLGALTFPYSSPSTFSFSIAPLTPPTEVPVPGEVDVSGSPDIDSLVVPEKPGRPTIPTITLGSMRDITLPDIPTIEFPDLSVTAPSYSFSDPVPWNFNINNILISDDPMIKAAIDRLTANIANGGTGLSADVEEAIWDREKERSERQIEDTTDKVTSMWAKKGFSLPDGLLAHSLSEVQKEYMNKRLDSARDIAIKQAELEQSNLFKSLELSVSLASTLINMLMRYEEIVFNGQEATAKFANEYIDMQIKTYAAKIEGYRATAQVHEFLIRSNISKVELYKAQIEGQKAVLDINEQTVKVYSEQLRSTAIMIDTYKTEVDAMVAELQIEKAKIEANKLQFDAWAKKVDVNISKYNGEVEMYKAGSMQNIATAELENKYLDTAVRTSLAAVEYSLKSFEVSEHSIQAKAALAMEAAKGVAQTTAQMAAGAMAAMSAQASMSYGETQPFNAVAQ